MGCGSSKSRKNLSKARDVGLTKRPSRKKFEKGTINNHRQVNHEQMSPGKIHKKHKHEGPSQARQEEHCTVLERSGTHDLGQLLTAHTGVVTAHECYEMHGGGSGYPHRRDVEPDDIGVAL